MERAAREERVRRLRQHKLPTHPREVGVADADMVLRAAGETEAHSRQQETEVFGAAELFLYVHLAEGLHSYIARLM